jgi:tRNA A-37 threonylcarbamoyl transferase component Bud32/tetratricopeptide (TPR) repeat protein
MHPGDVVDERFEILRTAGSGGMGVVYRARDRNTGSDVALKVLLEREGKPADRFVQEIELLSGIRHPHIVGYITHGTNAAGAPFLVMPWLEGHDLQERLRGGPLSVEATLTLARRVADALAYLHGRGLVHRDLKPSNLFLPDGKLEDVQVIDLGIAQATVPEKPLALSATVVGTPGFLAPEHALGDREIAPAVDMFALGCVLFECLTGQRLFGGSHLMAVVAKILVEEAPGVRELRPEVPEPLDRLIQRMVAKEPERRPRDGAQLVKLLEEMPTRSSIRPPGAPSIMSGERRVGSVLVVVLAPSTQVASLRASSHTFGVRVHALDGRTAIALAPNDLAAADQAAVLARFGRYLAESFRGASVALATGSAVAGSRLPMGAAIDRGVAMVREGQPGNGVYLDDISAALITSRFDLRREGGHLLLADERLSLDPTRPLLGRPTSCVGRDREFAILYETFAECVGGAGPKALLVTATAGAGKSRLGHEFLRRVRASSAAPVEVLQCRGGPLHVATPYALLAQAVRQAADLREREPPELSRQKLKTHLAALPLDDAARVMAFLGELVGAPFDDDVHRALRAARHSAEAMADQVGLAFEDAMRAWCTRRPVVLVLEDLHWGDAASIKAIDGALRRLRGEQLLVLALARPELHERFPGLWNKRDVTEIRLPPLPQNACAQLVREVIGDAVTDQEVRVIAELSGGNAFYLEELIRVAAERRLRETSRITTTGEDLPETILAMAQARFERLEPIARKVLRAASIFGEFFSVDDIGALIMEEPTALAPAIDALVEHEAIAPLVAQGEFVFRHVLLRSAAYATLLESDRALGHRLAAQWLEERNEDREIVALHWLEVGDYSRAAAHFERAAEARWARLQAESTARCAVRALLVGDPRREEIAAIALRVDLLANALEATRVIDERSVLAGIEPHIRLPEDVETPGEKRTIVHVAIDRVLGALRGVGDSPAISTTFARAAFALAALSDFVGAKRILAEATALAGDDAACLQEVRYSAASVASLAGDFGTVVDVLSAAVLPADRRQRLKMLIALAIAVVGVDGGKALGIGLDYISRAEALVGTSGDPVSEVQCAKARLVCHHLAGQHQDAAREAEAAIAMSRHAGLRFDECLHLNNLGEEYFLLGDTERARAAIVAAHEIARDIGADDFRLYGEAMLAYLDANSSRLEEIANELLDTSYALHEMHARYWLGRLLVAKRAPHARRELARALDLAKHLKFRTLADECSQALAELPAMP